MNVKLLTPLLVFSFILGGCGGKQTVTPSPGIVTTDSVQNMKGGDQPLPEPLPNPSPNFMDVKVYMENSGSMKGFNEKNCNGFTSVISELVGVYGRDKTKGYFYSDGLSVGYDAGKFADMIAGKKVVYGKSSPLHIIVDSIVKKNTSISFLITDGIMSGTDEQIRKDSFYNKNYREELQNNIIDKIRDKGLSASIYAFESYFDGIYYCYDNAKVKLSRNRPFYLIAIGPNACVKDFREKVEDGLSYIIPKNEVHFGLLDSCKEPKLFAGSQGKVDSCMITVDAAKIRKFGMKIDNVVCLDLSMPLPDHLPSYMKTKEYLQKNLEIAFNKKCIVNEKFVVYNVETQTVHIYLALNELLKNNSLQCVLKYELPQWCTKDSSEDDKGIKSDMFPRTFNLVYLIKGFRNGIEYGMKEIWNINYQIKK